MRILRLSDGEYVREKDIPRRYIVLHSPGWPGGLEVTPNTLEKAQEHVREHGGEVHWRYQSEWEKA